MMNASVPTVPAVVAVVTSAFWKGEPAMGRAVEVVEPVR